MKGIGPEREGPAPVLTTIRSSKRDMAKTRRGDATSAGNLLGCHQISLVGRKESVSLLKLPRKKAVGREARFIHGSRVAGMEKLRLVQLTCSGATFCATATRF